MVMACLNTLSFAAVVVLLPLTPLEFGLGCSGLCIGAVPFLMSRQARAQYWGPLSYARWHTLWHLAYPIGGSIWVLLLVFGVRQTPASVSNDSTDSLASKFAVFISVVGCAFVGLVAVMRPKSSKP